MEDIILQTVVETTEYIKQASSCMNVASRTTLIDCIAHNPTAGVLIAVLAEREKLGGQVVCVRAKEVVQELFITTITRTCQSSYLLHMVKTKERI